MTKFKLTQQKINQIKGNYSVRSPYHKRKRIPFNIIGHDISRPEYPVRVYTEAYRGWEKVEIFTNYTLESIDKLLNEGKLKKEKEQEKTQISLWEA